MCAPLAQLAEQAENRLVQVQVLGGALTNKGDLHYDH